MKLIKPSYEILTPLNGAEILRTLEVAGRTCYKSEDKITEDSAKKFVATLIKSGHHSVIEHCSFSVRLICDRGILAEITRHRISSFSVESTRFCNYSKDKFGNELTFIIPCWSETLLEGSYNDDLGYDYMWNSNDAALPALNCNTVDGMFMGVLNKAELNYFGLLAHGWSPQQARSVLPNSLKTEIVITANLREWRTIFTQRCALAAHPQMRELMHPLLKDIKSQIPIVFDDIYPDII